MTAEKSPLEQAVIEDREQKQKLINSVKQETYTKSLKGKGLKVVRVVIPWGDVEGLKLWASEQREALRDGTWEA